MTRWSALLVAAAGGMGASGVGLAAWAAHHAGGDMATTAAYFLLMHAGPVAAIALASCRPAMLIAASALALGSILFSGDLSLLAIGGLKPLPLAAPSGGMLMIAGWIWLGGAGLTAARKSLI